MRIRHNPDPDPRHFFFNLCLLSQWRRIDYLHVKSFSLPNFDGQLPSCEGRDPRGSVVFSEATNSFGIRPPPPPVKGQEHARQQFNLHTYSILLQLYLSHRLNMEVDLQSFFGLQVT
jgi:hypothetical protein